MGALFSYHDDLCFEYIILLLLARKVCDHI